MPNLARANRLSVIRSAARAGVVLSATALSSTMALAQVSANKTNTDTSASVVGVGDIVVTAQKREERLINTPQSVSVVGAADIAKLSAVQFLDVANTIPGLSFNTSGAGTTRPSIRGITVGADVSSTVGFYVDDVPYGASKGRVALEAGLFDLDRLEVLRGPQGTLYGASTLGGLIKYVTKRPDPNNFGGDAQAGLSGTEHGGVNFNLAAAANIPIARDKVGVRISGFESRDGGYIDNLARGRSDVNRSDTYGGRVDILIKPSEPFSIRLTGFAQNINRSGEGTIEYTTAGDPQYGSLTQYRQHAEPFKDRYRLVSATLGYDASWFNLTSISSYQTVRQDYVWDLAAVYTPLLNSIFGPVYGDVAASTTDKTKKFTQEVRLSSKGGGSIEWLLGGFYTHEKISEDQFFLLYDPAGQPLPNNLFTYFVPSTYREYAVFANATWHLSRKFDIAGGIRYADNRQTSSQTGSGLLGVSQPRTAASENVATYLANARYHFSNHLTGYFRFATGYRPGGSNFATIDATTGLPNGPASYKSDSLNSYELGLKGETSDRRFSIDLSAYHIDWSNIQVQFVNGGFAGITNAPGGATVNGGELSATARPITPLTANVALAYQHATLNNDVPAIGGSKGDRLPDVARVTATGNVDYALSETGLKPTIGATIRYIGRRNGAFGAFPQNWRLPAYTNIDLRFALTANAEGTHPIQVQFYVRNVTDKRGQLAEYLPQFGSRIAIQQPRTGGVLVRTSF